MTPPMGWRSWNAFASDIDERTMLDAIEMLLRPIRTRHHGRTTLADVGYRMVGLDEGWEACGVSAARPPFAQHAADGSPTINTTRFPDLSALVQRAHNSGLRIGWYLNGCHCGERTEAEANYAGDVRLLTAFGFDGAKLDMCGAQRNMTRYAELLERHQGGGNSGSGSGGGGGAGAGGGGGGGGGKLNGYLVENCKWGRCTAGDDSSCPTATWCPFSWFRTSSDIAHTPYSWLLNMHSTRRFVDADAPLSRPSCWAYPDMMQVGNLRTGPRATLHLRWNRAHFGGWCIVSSPLILGFAPHRLHDAELTRAEQRCDSMLDVLTNPEAIAINQAWVGSPGALVWSQHAQQPPHQQQQQQLADQTVEEPPSAAFVASAPCADEEADAQLGWSLQPLPPPRQHLRSVGAPGGGCLHVTPRGSHGANCAVGPCSPANLRIEPCNSSDPCQAFAHDNVTGMLTTRAAFRGSGAGGSIGGGDLHASAHALCVTSDYWTRAVYPARCTDALSASQQLRIVEHRFCVAGGGSLCRHCLSRAVSEPEKLLKFPEWHRYQAAELVAGKALVAAEERGGGVGVGGAGAGDPPRGTVSNTVKDIFAQLATTLHAWAKVTAAAGTAAMPAHGRASNGKAHHGQRVALHAVAVLLINPDAEAAHIFRVPLDRFPFFGAGAAASAADLSRLSFAVRDVWQRADLATMPVGSSTLEAEVGPLDSSFLVLTPVA